MSTSKVKSTIKRVYAKKDEEKGLDLVTIELAREISGFRVINESLVDTQVNTIKMTLNSLIRTACSCNETFACIHDTNRKAITKLLSMFFLGATIEVEPTKVQAGDTYAYDENWSLVILDGKSAPAPASDSDDDSDAGSETDSAETEDSTASKEASYRNVKVADRSFYSYRATKIVFTEKVNKQLDALFDKILEKAYAGAFSDDSLF